MPRTTIHDLLGDARRRLKRLTPQAAFAAVADGGVLIDTRSEEDLRRFGTIPGARHHPLSVLEWTLDPASEHADPTNSLDSWLILICAEGYSSSLAAARLQELGFIRATDVIGGFDAWRDAGLPIKGPPT